MVQRNQRTGWNFDIPLPAAANFTHATQSGVVGTSAARPQLASKRMEGAVNNDAGVACFRDRVCVCVCVCVCVFVSRVQRFFPCFLFILYFHFLSSLFLHPLCPLFSSFSLFLSLSLFLFLLSLSLSLSLFYCFVYWFAASRAVTCTGHTHTHTHTHTFPFLSSRIFLKLAGDSLLSTRLFRILSVHWVYQPAGCYFGAVPGHLPSNCPSLFLFGHLSWLFICVFVCLVIDFDELLASVSSAFSFSGPF